MQILEVAVCRRMCCSRVWRGEDEAFAATVIGGLADDAAGHLAQVLRLGGKEADVRATEGGRRADGLAFADNDIGAVVAGRLEHGEGDGVGRDDQEGLGLMGQRWCRG